MVEITTTHYTLAELLELFGVNAQWLIKESELHPETVRRALDDSPEGLKTHVTSAFAMANAFGLTPDEIKWPRGLCENGRTAHSGGTYTETTTVTITVKKTVHYDICPKHRLELSATGTCGDCE